MWGCVKEQMMFAKFHQDKILLLNVKISKSRSRPVKGAFLISIPYIRLDQKTNGFRAVLL